VALFQVKTVLDEKNLMVELGESWPSQTVFLMMVGDEILRQFIEPIVVALQKILKSNVD
jgi:hypothetical protein